MSIGTHQQSQPELPDGMNGGLQKERRWATPHLAHSRRQDVQDVSHNISHKLEQQRKDDFLSMASHELKTPITTLKAFLQLISSGDGPHVIVPKTHLKKMVDQVDRLTRVVSDLLEVSKIQKGELEFASELVDMDKVVRDVVADARSHHNSHKFHIEGAVGCKVRGDKERLAQAISELLNNAVKFSPASENIHVSMSCPEAHVEVEVRDHGIGMPAAEQELIFQRYYRVLKDPAQPFPGLGVGLFIVSEIVRHHGGNVGVSSVAGEGSSFTIALPIDHDQK